VIKSPYSLLLLLLLSFFIYFSGVSPGYARLGIVGLFAGQAGALPITQATSLKLPYSLYAEKVVLYAVNVLCDS